MPTIPTSLSLERCWNPTAVEMPASRTSYVLGHVKLFDNEKSDAIRIVDLRIA
jgi:hypothetical protein